MNEEQLIYLLALLEMEGVGNIIARNLIAYCGSPKEIFNKPKSTLKNIPEVGDQLAGLLAKKTPDLTRAEKEISFCKKNDIIPVTFMDINYPELLKTIHNSPVILFQKGKINLNDYASVAIVGTRTPSEYGRKFARIFADYFVEKGINVISGLAYGIDYEAHSTTVSNNGITTAVLGHGLSMIYPFKHKSLADKISETGALLTEFYSDTAPDNNNFPKRNRIIAGISRATVVIEAAEKGGALITARFAFEQNREVYALPGNIGIKTSEGCNHLIRDNIAKLVTKPEEVIEDLGPLIEFNKNETSVSKFKAIEIALSADEQEVIHALEKGGLVLDELAEVLNKPVSQIITLLLTLEFKGVITQLPGRKFIRV